MSMAVLEGKNQTILIFVSLQDYQLYRDLRQLEDASKGERWLTLPEDDDKWEQYARENGFVAKLSTGKSSARCDEVEKWGYLLESSSSSSSSSSTLILTVPAAASKQFLTVQSDDQRL